MRRALRGVIMFLAIFATLQAMRWVGLYDGHLSLLSLGAGVALLACIIDRPFGALATGLAYMLESSLVGHTQLIATLHGCVYAAGATGGALAMRAAHLRGATATFTQKWTVLLMGAAALTATVIAGREVEALITPSHHNEGYAVFMEAMANMVGVLASASIIVNLRELRDGRLLTGAHAFLLVFLLSQVALFWWLLNTELGFASRTALLMVASLPAAMVVAVHSHRSLGVSVVSTLWTAAGIWLSIDYAGGAHEPEFQLHMMFLTGLFICSQMIHMVNKDRVASLSRNRDQNAELERRVAERTAKLEAMTARAMAADEAKSEFLAVMSHELRTPMNGVLGMSELLRESGVTDRQQVFLDVIRSSSQALLTIISDILDFSRIDAGKLEINEAPFETAEIAGDYIAPLALEADRKGVEVVVRLDPALPSRISADAARLRQVCINLLGNAVKFTDEGRITMDVSEAADPDGARMLRIEMRDTGPGVPVELRETIFDKFSQGDGTATRRSGGSGLGLSICRGVAQLMQGRVGVDPRPGGGSVFWFEAPLRTFEDSETIAQSLPDCISGGRALIIDGNAAQTAVLSELMEQAGLSLETAATWEAALKMVRPEDPPQFVVLGDARPRRAVEAAVRALRSAAGQDDLPIALLITPSDIESRGYVTPDLANLALLVKPLRAPAVIEALDALCDRAVACVKRAHEP